MRLGHALNGNAISIDIGLIPKVGLSEFLGLFLSAESFQVGMKSDWKVGHEILDATPYRKLG